MLNCFQSVFVFLRLCVFAPLSLNIVASREDFSGARTALSACFFPNATFVRTRLSALLWLRLCGMMPLG